MAINELGSEWHLANDFSLLKLALCISDSREGKGRIKYSEWIEIERLDMYSLVFRRVCNSV